MTKPADLLAYLFEAQQRSPAMLLSGELLQWMDSSTRYTAFVETYRDKIRKKIRVTRDSESTLDLRSELEVARALLADRHMVVAYEPYSSEKRRGADFAVTYRANLVFNIEVARIRAEQSTADEAQLARKEERVVRILLDKLGQMQPGMANLLVIHTRPEVAQIIDLGRLMQEIKIKAEGKDPSFYALSRYNSPTAFYKDFAHLSGILLWAAVPASAPAKPGSPLWVNKQARPPLPGKVLRLVSLASQTPPLPSEPGLVR